MINNIYNISIQQIAYILSLEEERNFKRASELNFVTQPTLSMQIKKAEDDLGFSIFDRSIKPVGITKEGKELIPILRDLQNEYQRIWKLKDVFEGKTFELRVGIIPTVSTYLIRDLTLKMFDELNNLKIFFIELPSQDLLDEISAGKIDMGIMAGPYVSPNIRTIPLFKEEVKLYMPQISSGKVATEELVGEKPRLLSKENCLRTQMINFCSLSDENKPNDWNYTGGNIEILKSLVDAKGGYTLIPEFYQGPEELKTIYDKSTGVRPAREIIALLRSKAPNIDDGVKLSRLIQLLYPKSNENLKVLSWQ